MNYVPFTGGSTLFFALRRGRRRRRGRGAEEPSTQTVECLDGVGHRRSHPQDGQNDERSDNPADGCPGDGAPQGGGSPGGEDAQPKGGQRLPACRLEPPPDEECDAEPEGQQRTARTEQAKAVSEQLRMPGGLVSQGAQRHHGQDEEQGSAEHFCLLSPCGDCANGNFPHGLLPLGLGATGG